MRTPSILLALGFTLAAAPVLAGDDWKFMPVGDAGYKPDVTLSALIGSMDPKNAGNHTFSGAEVAFNCLLLQPPSGVIRSKLSVGQFDHNGLKLTSYELNPRWTINIDKNLSVGFGPGLGYIDAKAGGQSKGMWAGQVGADLDYRIGMLNLGLAVRWQGTGSDTIAPGYKGADNTLIEAKVGVNF